MKQLLRTCPSAHPTPLILRALRKTTSMPSDLIPADGWVSEHFVENGTRTVALVRFKSLQQFFAWLVVEDEIGVNPMADMTAPFVPTPPYRWSPMTCWASSWAPAAPTPSSTGETWPSCGSSSPHPAGGRRSHTSASATSMHPGAGCTSCAKGDGPASCPSALRPPSPSTDTCAPGVGTAGPTFLSCGSHRRAR
jgi:hypothetical protein